MADCSEKRFQDMLHAYELGLLSDNDREEFEMHLMECEVCFEKVQNLTQAVSIVRHDPELQATVEKIVIEKVDQTEPELPDTKASFFRSRLWPSLVPSVIVVALLVVLILKPWQIEISSTQEAIAIENRLAIMYFENLADPDDEHNLGEIITSLLITDLSESEYVSVISSQRLYDIARVLGEDKRTSLDRETAMEIARQAEAKWMLLGSIHQTEPYYSLAGQLIDVSTGNVIASQLIAGEPGNDIFPLIDKLTAEVKNDLTLPSAAMQEKDRMVADVTTHSSTAYRYYIDGIDYFDKFYMDEAQLNFSKAVEYDSTFAMAYYYLARITKGKSSVKNLKQAMLYLDKVSQKERYYILSLHAARDRDPAGAINQLEQLLKRYPDEKEALFLIANYYYSQQNIEKLTEYLERVIALDPFHKSSYNMLAYAYHFLGKNERSIEMVDRYVALAPDEANPYDTRGDLLNRMGRLEEAIASYEKAVEIKPDFLSSRLALIYLSLYQRQYSRAEQRVAEFAECGMENAESLANLYLSHIYMFRGEVEKALSTIDVGLKMDSADKNYSLMAEKYYTRAMIYDGIGDYNQAIEYIRKTTDAVSNDKQSSSITYKHAEIEFLARAGKFDEAKRFLEDYSTRTDDIPMLVGRYYYCRGVIAFEKGDYKTAISELKQSLEERKSFSHLTNYMLARSYMKNGQYEAAIDIFEKNINNHDLWRLFYGVQDSKTYYYLGLANEKLGRYEKAAKMYEYFLEIWKDADPVFTEIDDAAQRLARLKSRS